MPHEVTEYQVPLNMVRRKPGWSQSRITDCHANQITELANQIHSDPHGLRTGICVCPNSDGHLDLCWGNNRLRAVQQNNNNNLAIPGLRDGYIWVTRYQHKQSELTKWQALENNIHPVSQAASYEDNVGSLEDMVRDGILDDSNGKFVDCNDAEKKRRLKKIIEEVMPSMKSKSAKLINKYRARNKTTFKVFSYTVDEMRNRLKNILSEDEYDLESLKDNNFIIERLTGKRIKVLITKNSAGDLGGSKFQTAVQSKVINKDFDEVWLVSAHNNVAEVNLDKVRKEREQLIITWNRRISPHPNLIDRMLVLPQSVSREIKTMTVVADILFP